MAGVGIVRRTHVEQANCGLRLGHLGQRKSRIFGLALGWWLATFSVATAQIAPGTPPCDTVSGTSVECTGPVTAGDLGQGIALSGPAYDTLTLFALTGAAIAPNSGVSGINFQNFSGGDISIDSDVTGIPGISTTNASGIYAYNYVSTSGSPSNSLTGGDVIVTSDGTITTTGDNAHGIAAQSVAYGYGYDGSGSGASSSTTGGNVTVSNLGAIGTTSNYARGIYANNQAYASSYETGAAGSADAVATGGGLSVINDGTITTAGSYDADGIYAQSYTYSDAYDYAGAGSSATSTGGNLSVANAGTIDATGSSYYGDGIYAERNVYSLAYNYYGAGSGSFSATSAGGAFDVTNTGTITTAGYYAHGIYARDRIQSEVRDYGGTGAATYTATSIGSVVTLTNSDTIETSGQQSYGLYFDGYVTAYAYAYFNSTTADAFNAEATGSNATIANDGTITTTGDYAYGIYAYQQTYAQSYDYWGTGTGSFIATATGGAIDVTNSGSVDTSGTDADGVRAHLDTYAYAYNANVGTGVTSLATGGALSVINDGTITTTNHYAEGIVAQVNTNSRSYTNSSTGAASADTVGGTFEVTNNGTISTGGQYAHGVSANDYVSSFVSDDYGAGTGLFRASLSGGVHTATNTDTITTTGYGAHGVNSIADANSTVRSYYGDGAATYTAETTGGALTDVNSGTISTSGYGAAGMSVTQSANASAENYYSTGSGAYSASATGGTVAATNDGTITTSGDNARGIEVYSQVYSQAYDSTNAATGSFTATATGGAIDVTNSGTITTSGTFSHGISATNYAYSSAPTSLADATAGDITVTSSGTVSATGLDSVAIYSQSVASGCCTLTNGDITVDITSGTVTGGSGAGAGVEFLNGSTNTLANAGVLSALSGLAVRGGTGNETIDNAGLIIGNVHLGAGSNAFNNAASGTYQSDTFANLGGGTLTNRGDVTPGGSGPIQTTAITGNFVQEASGTYTVDADWATATADVLTVTGTAMLAGTVVVVPANFPTTAGLTQQFLILQATGGATDNGIAATDTATVNYEVVFDPNGVDVYLTALINFLGVGTGELNPNQTAIAENINAILAAGGTPGFSPVATALMTLPTQAALANALDQLSPEIYSYQKLETLFASEQFSTDLMSCRVADGSGAAFIREGQCIWVRGRARFLDLDTTADNIGSDTTVGSFSAGGQVALAGDWKLGFAAGYDNVSVDTGTGAFADGARANIGSVLKYNPGPLLLAASVSGGWSSFDTVRPMAFGGFAATAEGESDIDYVAGRLHAAYLIDQGALYLKPQVDGSVTHLDFGGLTETGGGGAGLVVPGHTDTVYAVTPALEIGGELRFGDLSVLRPFVRVGVTWRDSDSLDLAASFATAPAGVGPFTINTALDDVLAEVSAGFDVINHQGAALRLQYDGRFGEETAQNSASIKGSVPF